MARGPPSYSLQTAPVAAGYVAPAVGWRAPRCSPAAVDGRRAHDVAGELGDAWGGRTGRRAGWTTPPPIWLRPCRRGRCCCPRTPRRRASRGPRLTKWEMTTSTEARRVRRSAGGLALRVLGLALAAGLLGLARGRNRFARSVLSWFVATLDA